MTFQQNSARDLFVIDLRKAIEVLNKKCFNLFLILVISLLSVLRGLNI